MKKEMRDSGEFFGCYDSIIYGGVGGSAQMFSRLKKAFDEAMEEENNGVR